MFRLLLAIGSRGCLGLILLMVIRNYEKESELEEFAYLVFSLRSQDEC